MSLSVSIGGLDPLSFSGAKDLVSDARATNLNLGTEFREFLTQPLSAIPANMSSTAIQWGAGGGTWTPGGGTVPTNTPPPSAFLGISSPLTFTLTGGVCGKVAVRTAGSLLSYTDGFAETVSTSLSTPVSNKDCGKTVDVEQGVAYLALELDFTISGGLNGSFQQGIYGVSTADTASATISVAFYKRCSPSTSLGEALKAAFEGFVLPLHAKTLEELTPGDYLHYNFNGNLQLGLGASVGFDKVLYAGTAAATVPKTAGAITISASATPELQAGVKFSFAYDYCGTFEVLLWSDADRKAHMHLYRAQTQTVTAGAMVGISFLSEASAEVGATPTAAAMQAVGAMTNALPQGLQATFSGKVVPAALGEVAKFAGEVNDKVAGWLTHTNGSLASLGFAIQRTGSTFLLSDYTVDLANPGYGNAWKLMLAGRFLDAMQMAGSGVSLDTGSGTEALYSQASSIKLNLFGAFHAAWTDTTLSNSQLVYAGDNVFHLITDEGKDVLDSIGATKKELTMYFAAEADLSMTAASAIGPPMLHCMLQATNDTKFGQGIAKLAGQLSSGPSVNALAAQMAAAAKLANSVVTLQLLFAPGAYGRLTAATITNGKPDDESKDAANYAAFQKACATTFGGGPAGFSWGGRTLDYSLWRSAWIASNDEWPAPDGSLPNRRESAGLNSSAGSMLSETFPGLNGQSGEGELIFYAFEAAAQFMNFCDDLRALSSETGTYTPETWKSFVAGLAKIVKNDLNTDFMPATMLALAELCGGVPTTVSGPGLAAGRTIGVTMEYGS